MRFFGFITGIAVLIGLFFLADYRKLFLDHEPPLQGEPKNATAAKFTELEKKGVKNTKPLTDKPVVKKQVDNRSVANASRNEMDEINNGSATRLSDREAGSASPASRPLTPFQAHLRSKTFEEAESNRLAVKSKSATKAAVEAEPESQASPAMAAVTESETKPDSTKITEIKPLLAADESLSDKVQWHSFWGPFTTRNSAKGFAENIAKRTAIKVDIIERKPGQYMVAYPYQTEADRRSIASLIEERTSLKIDAN